MEQIILIGGGGHAHSVMDSIIQAGKYEIAGFVDRTEMKGTIISGFRVIGTDNDLKAIYDSGVRNACISIGFMGKNSIREKIYDRLKQIGYEMPRIIDTSAVIAEGADIAEGTYIGKMAIVNSNVKIGKMCIINTGAIIEHDNYVDDFSHIAVGSVLCGNVYIGRGCFIGANATIIQDIGIGDGVIVGAGVTVRHDVQAGQVYYDR